MADLQIEAFFDADSHPPPGITAERIEAAARFVLAEEGVAAATLSLAFVDDERIAALNQQFLGHAGPTDVLSFALHGPSEPPHGDIYVGAVQAWAQAREYGVGPGEEWLRLAIHGTLHVLGYEHPESADREQSPMYRRQEALLAAFREAHP